jgi:TPR repeat protein
MANSGDPEANMGLSKWYLCGAEGYPPNEEKAFIYAERAAKKGLPQAEFAMGKFLCFSLTLRIFLRGRDLRNC